MRKLFVFLIMALLFSTSLSSAQEENRPPTLTGAVTPRDSYAATPFLFTATYTDLDNDPPAFIYVYIDGAAHTMDAVDPSDGNYSSGKDYQFRKYLSDGPVSFYFKTSDGNHTVSTRVQTLNVRYSGIFGGDHWDIILWGSIVAPVAALLCIAALLQLRAMRKTMERLAKAKENSFPGEEKDRPADVEKPGIEEQSEK